MIDSYMYLLSIKIQILQLFLFLKKKSKCYHNSYLNPYNYQNNYLFNNKKKHFTENSSTLFSKKIK